MFSLHIFVFFLFFLNTVSDLPHIKFVSVAEKKKCPLTLILIWSKTMLLTLFQLKFRKNNVGNNTQQNKFTRNLINFLLIYVTTWTHANLYESTRRLVNFRWMSHCVLSVRTRDCNQSQEIKQVDRYAHDSTICHSGDLVTFVHLFGITMTILFRVFKILE